MIRVSHLKITEKNTARLSRCAVCWALLASVHILSQSHSLAPIVLCLSICIYILVSNFGIREWVNQSDR